MATAFSVGIGLTNECNLRCAHCYRPDMVQERLTRADVRRVCDVVVVGSMNLGVGENGLHPEYRGILDDLAARGIKTSITSNGLSIDQLDDAQLTRFHSVELSLDFPTEGDHDAFRGPGNWQTVVAALERCVSLNVRVTVTTVMMTINYRRLPALARLAAGFGANLRVNVYQPSRTDRFTLAYEQLWDGFRGLAATTRLVATTEPVLAGVLGLRDFPGPGCGRSTVRIAPDGRVMPCTYWPGSHLTIDDLAPGRARHRRGGGVRRSAAPAPGMRRLSVSRRLRGSARADRAPRRPGSLLPVRARRAHRPRLGARREPGSSEGRQRVHHGCLGGLSMAQACRPAVVGSLPRSLYLETTNRCDSKCQTCIRTFETLEPPADLTLDRVRAIVDQFPLLDRVVLHGIGEPLLNPEIFDIVAHLKTRVASVLFNSDAISLTPARARRLIESGLDEYRVSLDAATAATYRQLPRRRPVRARDRQRHAAGRPGARAGPDDSPRLALVHRLAGERRGAARLRAARGRPRRGRGVRAASGLERPGARHRGERAARPAERTRARAARRGGSARDAPRHRDAGLRADQPPRQPRGER